MSEVVAGRGRYHPYGSGCYSTHGPDHITSKSSEGLSPARYFFPAFDDPKHRQSRLAYKTTITNQTQPEASLSEGDQVSSHVSQMSQKSPQSERSASQLPRVTKQPRTEMVEDFYLAKIIQPCPSRESPVPLHDGLDKSAEITDSTVSVYCEKSYTAFNSASTEKEHKEPIQATLLPCEQGDQGLANGPYSTLLYQCFLTAPGHMMCLKDIYSWFEKSTSKPGECAGKGRRDGWKNSIRHNLSMNEGFVKVEKPEGKDGSKRDHTWMLSKMAQIKGVESTTRFRAKSGRDRHGGETKRAADSPLSPAMSSDPRPFKRHDSTVRDVVELKSKLQQPDEEHASNETAALIISPSQETGQLPVITDVPIKKERTALSLDLQLEFCHADEMKTPTSTLSTEVGSSLPDVPFNCAGSPNFRYRDSDVSRYFDECFQDDPLFDTPIDHKSSECGLDDHISTSFLDAFHNNVARRCSFDSSASPGPITCSTNELIFEGK